MIQFHHAPAPHPAEVALFLEEAGLPREALPCEALPVYTRRGEQHRTQFRAIHPAKQPKAGS